MSYRILLPCPGQLRDTSVQQALDTLDIRRLRDFPPRWQVSDLAGEPEHNGDSRIIVSLCGRDAVTQEPGADTFFFMPPRVQCWVAVGVKGGQADRAPRLHARLVALQLAERLNLAVLETRNGVYCRTPEAFAAWCARESHPETVLLAKQAHVTTAPRRRTHATRRPGAGTRHVASAADGTCRQHLPLPREAWTLRLWHRLTGAKPYVISIPKAANPSLVHALVAEVEGTFHRHNVVYEQESDRLVIYGKDTRGARDLVRYFRRRAHPERLRAVPSYAGI